MIKKFGFTLTEVLVTLSVVGVIAAMTVPTLMSKYQKEAQTVQIRKASQELANAIDMFITAEGKTSLVATGIFDNVDAFITSNLKVVKTCDANDTSCFATSYRSIDNSQTATVNCAGNSYVLANSAAICITVEGNNTEEDDDDEDGGISGWLPSLDRPILQYRNPYLTVLMDTNGAEKPNIGGRDMFTFFVTKQGEITGTSPGLNHAIVCGLIHNPDGTTTADCPGCEEFPLGNECYNTLVQNNWKMTY